jgi:hypothetical protein
LPVRLGGVGHRQRNVLDAVAVRAREAGELAVAAQPARQDEADVLLLEDVRRPVADTRLRAGIRGRREAEGVLVVEGGLLRIPDVELEVVPAFDREEVGLLPHEIKD